MFDLDSVELDPAKLHGGVYWHVWRESDGGISGKPVPAAPEAKPWMLIVPGGFALERALDEERRMFVDRLRSGGKLTDEESLGVFARAYARAVLRGWGNMARGGHVIPYSQEKAVELLLDDRWRRVREFVVRAAQDLAAAAAREEEQAAGN